jgi:predicted small lipoprotein YifL
MLRTVAVATVILSLAGCGLKGDLFLPPEPPPAAADTPPASDTGTAPADGDDDTRRQVPAAPDRSQAQ